MKGLIYGSILLLVLVSISFLTVDFSILIEVGGVIGVGAILLAGLATGAGPGINLPILGYSYTQYKDRKMKVNPSLFILMLGLPNLLGAIITYLWMFN